MHRSIRGGFILSHYKVHNLYLARTITDIPWYMLTDASHLHLVDSRNSKRKFLLKLEKQEKDRLAEEKRRHSTTPMLNPSELQPIELPIYIEREPSDVLRLEFTFS